MGFSGSVNAGIVSALRCTDTRPSGAPSRGSGLRTNEGLKRLAVVDAAVSQNWDGVHALGKLNGDELKCAGLSHAIDYDANTVKLVVPASCLSRPRWVQAYIGADGYATTASVGQPTFTHDNGLSGGTEHAGWTGRVRAG